MITSLRIQDYKCFSDQIFDLGALTLLAGANATGKSTVVQSLLLLRQSYLRGTLSHGELLLNGPLVNVGTALDAVNETASTDTVAFTITDDDSRSQRFAFDYPRGEGESYTLRGSPYISQETPHFLFSAHFNYLNAERVGPRLLYPMSEMIGDFVDVGIHGEYTAHCLNRFGSVTIANANLIHNDHANSRMLFDQTRYWMSEIVPDLDIDLQAITEANQMRIGLRTSTGRFLRPTNIGFGIIYTLPIVVASLLSVPNSLLIVENPEAHLHPASQSQIGMFLARVAAAGVQVIIETHSDHVLNGIRRSVRSSVLAPEQVSILFFQGAGQVIAPKMYKNGGIRPWPQGFFDQIERDLKELF